MKLLDQTCPTCGITEAAGGYCTACEQPTLPLWGPPKRSARQRATAARFVVNQRKESPRAASEAA
jgi:hypothetical protein